MSPVPNDRVSAFPVVHLTGTPFERGVQHGRLARDRVLSSLRAYGELFACCGLDWATVRQNALPFRAIIGDFGTEYLTEIEGIAEGAGLDALDIVALNARTELLPPDFPRPHDAALAATYDAALKANAAFKFDVSECTSIAVAPSANAEGQTWLAQNWDWMGRQRAALIVQHITHEGEWLVTLSEAGMLAKIGLNSRGFGVCLNILKSSTDGSRHGVPVHVLLRALLTQSSVSEAAKLIAGCTFGSSSNILCADAAGELSNFELSPSGVARLSPNAGLLMHTNHYLDPALAKTDSNQSPLLTTQQRFDCAATHIATHGEDFGYARIKALLQDNSQGLQSVSRLPDPDVPAPIRVESVAGIIMNLTERSMHIAPAVPHTTRFAPVHFERDT